LALLFIYAFVSCRRNARISSDDVTSKVQIYRANTLVQSRDAMTPRIKVASVLGGYIVAFLIASVVVAIYVAATSGADRQAYGAMYGFGDSLLFLAVLGVAAVPATAAALFFLRPCRSFWLVLSVVALALALTGVAACIEYLGARTAFRTGSTPSAWSGLAVLRILVAPLFALTFLLSGLFAPSRFARIALVVAAVIEAAIFARWFHSLHP
jgi:hypothetical protein